MTGIVKQIHVLIEVECSRCNGLCRRLGVADVVDGRIANEGRIATDEPVCNDCERAEREEENRQWKASKQRRAWVKRMVKKNLKP